MIFSCCNENRKAAVLGNPSGLNGIDYLEVLDHAAIAIPSPRQQTLLVHCLVTAPPAANISPNNVLITGGESITGITAEWIAPASQPPPQATIEEQKYFQNLPNADKILVVRTSQYGDFSPYSFRLVNDASAAKEGTFDVVEALSGFDPQLAEVTFSFKVECGPEFDCKPPSPDCRPDLPTPPPINYLAKDYSSFRQVMLDRLNQMLPSWGANTEADIGVMLAELVSYAGDNLSYRQDAVATESYLLTARSRISLRRHARLVDYSIHEGCNARAWVQVDVSQPAFINRATTRFYTTMPAMPPSLEVNKGYEEAALVAGVVAFEPMEDAHLYPEQNLMNLYTWGDANCCLPQGATEATLQGTFGNLQIGDVLIFQEMMGPQTGVLADADIRHRCAVRLTAVATQNSLGETLVDPLFDSSGMAITLASQVPNAQPVTEIQWSSDDALPFPVCVSSQLEVDGTTTPLLNVSVALGNVVLCDQGLTMSPVELGTVPAPVLFYPPDPGGDRCQPLKATPLPVRFRPAIADSPVTQATPLPVATSPVTAGAVPLVAGGWASLNDSNGFASVMVAANAPLDWPQYFGVIANLNAADSSLFDLSVVFNPPGGPVNVAGQVTLELFAGLSLKTADPNYAGTVLGNSRFMQVSGTPLASTTPAKFPTAPAMLSNTSAVALKDFNGDSYLTVQATNPLGWPPLFSVLTQGQLNDPDQFNLLLLYSPVSAQGVSLPVLMEEFLSLSLDNLATNIGAASDLITVKTFEDEPNPSLSAYDLMNYDAGQAVPVMTLTSELNSMVDAVPWTAQPDLLASGAGDQNFVMEVDTGGAAYLRFGDGTNGKLPDAGTSFTAVYRIGNGTAGNVGAGSLTKFSAGVVADSAIESCTNPLPATGGIDPETNAQICRRAPQAFMTQERAITMQDYVNVVEQNPQVEDASADLRWTGSWYTVFITAEPQSNGPMSKALRRNLTRKVNQYRLAGQDILIEPPDYVSLNITLSVCVDSEYFQSDVQKALQQALGSGTLPNGQPALFAPQNFELGQTVYLSPIYAAARAVAGVEQVTATVFGPQGQSTQAYIQQGFIPMGPFQVARMANDPSLPANGQLRLKMKGGR